jgi:protein TonB
MATPAFLNQWTNLVSDVRTELVFEKRNRLYGAYMLRRNYSRTVSIAMLSTVTVIVLGILTPTIIRMLTPAEEEQVAVQVDLSQLEMEAPPPVDETTPPPPPPPPPPMLETIKFTPPVVVDEEVPDEAPVITQETETQIATVTQEGTGDEIIIPEETGPAVVEPEPDQVFISVEEMPQFPGGEEAMMKYIQKNVQYPAMERDAGIQGTVIVYFEVNKEGSVENAKVQRGVKGGAALDREAIRVISAMPRWAPGKQNGRPCRVQFNVPVRFVLR